MERTHYCGELTEQEIGSIVTLKGWVQKRRDLGGLIFVDVRDRSGLVQIVFNPDISKQSLEIAETIRNEFVIEVTGKVIKREVNQQNPNMKTGTIEIQAEDVNVINEAKTPPFIIEDETDVNEEIRLKYRYLDLRRPKLCENI